MELLQKRYRSEDIHILREKLKQSERIVLICHMKPDGDAMGSMLGLYGYLRKYNKMVTCISPTEIPDYLKWMPGTEDVLQGDAEPEKAATAFSDAEIIFCLDFSGAKRMDTLQENFLQAEGFKVLVDHHPGPEDLWDLSFHDPKGSSTAELIFRMIWSLSDTASIDHDMAINLYTGMMTDTGSFRFSSTNADVHHAAAFLLQKGIDLEYIHSSIYDNYGLNRLRFLGYCLKEKLTVLEELKTAYIIIDAKEITEYHASSGDTEGFVNYCLAIKGIVFGVIIIDWGDMVKMSFRSKGKFPANEVAGRFNGGGHLNAAGGRSHDNLEETEQKFLAILEEYRNLLSKS